ncbi:unnamed protein product [Spirodela intermedia]|uniref:Uncharacterized protein n=1 Tax=Spirodela intermedia TaxID=51605 RepID=A0A7I8J5Z1_SPIIN|nr:unnamed protein product [Spirodela intermedia]CAA6665667.1 unnamed protein product [Spirodela intermedia]
MRAANLTGVLPEEFGRLSHLSWIDLSRNYINGSIPAANWTSLPLKNFFLSGNNFSGELPETLSNLKNLIDVRLDGTEISGKIPSFTGNWTKLERL